MNVAVFSTKSYDREFFDSKSSSSEHFTYLEPRLTPDTAVLAAGHDAVCVFVHDQVDEVVLGTLAECGVKLVVIRAAGFNNVDLDAAKQFSIRVARVPAYSPAGVAEFTVGLMLSLNRNIHRAHDRVSKGNFSLEGLMGFNMKGKTAGVIGTGKIGQSVAEILLGFGCRVLAYDLHPNEDLIVKGAEHADLDTVFAESDIISLHVPLLPTTRDLVNAATIAKMRPGVMLINTSRGELIETESVIAALKSGHIGSLGIDVYEDEEGIFFEDLSNSIVADDQLMRMTTFPNVILTSHQAFFTREAMENIVGVTLQNIADFSATGECSSVSQLA